jgi:hypothetical protein
VNENKQQQYLASDKSGNVTLWRVHVTNVAMETRPMNFAVFTLPHK